MKAKKIINIVFYNYFENDKEERKACIFYRDGSVEETTYDGGIDACEEIVRERNITSTNAFKEMINNELVHVMTGEEFKNKFDNYVNKELIDREMIDEVIDESMPKIMVKENKITEEIEKPEIKVVPSVAEAVEIKEEIEKPEIEAAPSAVEVAEVSEIKEKNVKPMNNVTSRFHAATSEDLEDEDEDEDDYEEDYGEDDSIYAAEAEEEVDTARQVEEFEGDSTDDYDDEYDSEIEDEEVVETNKAKSDSRITKFFKKQAKKAKAGLLGLTILLGIGSAGAGYSLCKNSKTGKILANNIKNAYEKIQDAAEWAEVEARWAQELKEEKEATKELGQALKTEVYKINVETPTQLAGTPSVRDLKTVKNLNTGNNDNYNDYTYEQLLEVTNNKTQKTAMTNLGTAIFEFNGDFADAYVEEDKEIRAALKVEEVEALQVAYNDYSKDELKAIFNGTEVRGDKMSMDYKAASLQLMGAYIIENSENPVNMSYLLETQEGKDFYNKYHTMYLEAKEATGQDKLEKVNAFYAEIKKDFPITNDVRTEGIAHADSYATVEAYKLSVTPMIAAAEYQFQNLEIDYTLDDVETDFINDIGLCNYADDTFERLETITLSADEDKTNPTELQYRNAIIKALEAENHYVTNDTNRELSKLDRFINALNWHFDIVDVTGTGYGYASAEGTSSVSETSSTSTETNSWEESETSTETKTTVTKTNIPAEEKAKIDQEINEQNEEAKKKAEEEAEKKRQEEQAKADAEAKQKEEEANKKNEETKNKINNANDTINKNNSDQNKTNDKKVNEKDINAHVDPEHKDDNGNINDSVKDITTDGTGDETNNELPNPNETGAEFDKRAPEYQGTSTSTEEPKEFVDVSENKDDDTNNNNTSTSEGKYYDKYGNEYNTYEELLEAYVNDLTNTSETATNTDAYQYSK